MNKEVIKKPTTATTEGSNPEVLTNGKEKKEPMTNATTTKGVTTLKQLQKECRKIDLTQVRFKKGYKSYRWSGEENFDPNAPLTENDFNYRTKDSVRLDLHIKFGTGSSSYDFPHRDFFDHPSKKWELPDRENRSHPFRTSNPVVVKFQGGNHGKSRYRVHNDFTDTQILYLESTDEIVGVLYALDNDYLNEWLRQTIDPNIPNNWDDLHTDKEFEVLITTTTFSREKVKVIGRTYDECVEKMKQNDPELNKGEWVSGMKHTGEGEGEEGIPSYSYEDWVSSLQVKEVA